MPSPAPSPAPNRSTAEATAASDGASPDLPRIVASLGVGAWQRKLVSGEAWYSPRFMELLGYAADDLPNDTAASAAPGHPDNLEAFEQVRQTALTSFAPGSAEGRMPTRNGEWRWFRASVQA